MLDSFSWWKSSKTSLKALFTAVQYNARQKMLAAVQICVSLTNVSCPNTIQQLTPTTNRSNNNETKRQIGHLNSRRFSPSYNCLENSSTLACLLLSVLRIVYCTENVVIPCYAVQPPPRDLHFEPWVHVYRRFWFSKGLFRPYRQTTVTSTNISRSNPNSKVLYVLFFF